MKNLTLAFEKLKHSETINDVNKILDDLNIDAKYRMKDTLYPQLKFKITRQEINDLISKKVITEEYLINNISDADPLTKLLYSILWKNGDLLKAKHVVEGILSEEEYHEKDNGLVFYQFGKYLTKKEGEPIVDQHVLRAYGIYIAKGDEVKIERFKRLSVITKEDKNLITQYKSWLQNDLKQELRNKEDYTYHVDKVLFALGKSLKVRNITNNHKTK